MHAVSTSFPTAHLLSILACNYRLIDLCFFFPLPLPLLILPVLMKLGVMVVLRFSSYRVLL